MPFARMSEVLQDARRNRYCVAAFCCHNFESVKIVINAAERSEAPVIVMLYPAMAAHVPLTTFASITRDLAAKSKSNVCLHLDHCDDFDFIIETMKAGFQSVLIDASKRDYEENVAMTKRVVGAAKEFGADVEAELGFVGSAGNESDYMDDSKYTDPALAKRFAEETGISSLAVAVGNAHGNYKSAPKLDIKRIKELDLAANVPIVLHGGSGIPDAQLTEAIANGITKLNLGTDYFKILYESQRDYALTENGNLFGLTKAMETSGGAYAEGRIRLVSRR